MKFNELKKLYKIDTVVYQKMRGAKTLLIMHNRSTPNNKLVSWSYTEGLGGHFVQPVLVCVTDNTRQPKPMQIHSVLY